MEPDDFQFDIAAKVTRLSDNDLLSAAGEYAEIVGFRYFSTAEFDRWPDRPCQSRTIRERFGSWKRTLAIIGIKGGRKHTYNSEELVKNLEEAWKEIGRPPGSRKIARLAQRISASPYNRVWGSVRKACEVLARYHRGEITKDQLLAGSPDLPRRRALALDVRWKVLKRDNYRCTACGATPALDRTVILEVDHITPVARGGTNDLSNLCTLCRSCNVGKSDH